MYLLEIPGKVGEFDDCPPSSGKERVQMLMLLLLRSNETRDMLALYAAVSCASHYIYLLYAVSELYCCRHVSVYGSVLMQFELVST